MTLKTLPPYVAHTLTVLLVIMVLFLNISYWFNENVFDEANAKELIVSSLMLDSSRDAIASEIANKSLGKWPLVQRALGSRLESRISDFIAGPFGQPIINRIASTIHKQFTSDKPPAINIELGPIATLLLPRMPEPVQNITNKVTSIETPDALIEIDAKMDRVYDLGKFFTDNALFVGILALGTFVLLMWKTVDWRMTLRNIGIALVVGMAINLMALGMVQNYLSEVITNPNIKVIATNVYTAYAEGFRQQSSLFIVVGLLIVGIAYGVRFFQDLYQSLKIKLAEKSTLLPPSQDTPSTK
jgi:hypothetical protein